ncbi:SapC family protein [Catenovulum sediminis]|uniref:SapC family protein n=1 Tax=Catenovulum sediminis TaxID=1740262 RepID=A0ABV1RMB1_9ALTE
MITDYQILSQAKHQQLCVKTGDTNYLHNHTHMAPVLLPEVDKLAAHFPLCFSHHGHADELVLVALLGFEEHENVCFQHGHWLTPEIPLAFARQPFLVDQSNGQIFVDVKNPSVNPNEGEPLFTDSGKPSEYLREKMALLEQIYQAAHPTQHFVSTLQEYGLLEPVKLGGKKLNVSHSTLNGLYTIAIDKLAGLNDDFVLHLFHLGLLQPCYLIQHSMQNIDKLIALKRKAQHNH